MERRRDREAETEGFEINKMFGVIRFRLFYTKCLRPSAFVCILFFSNLFFVPLSRRQSVLKQFFAQQLCAFLVSCKKKTAENKKCAQLAKLYYAHYRSRKIAYIRPVIIYEVTTRARVCRNYARYIHTHTHTRIVVDICFCRRKV